MICGHTPTYGWLGGIVVQWVGVMLNQQKLNKSWPNQDNSILFEDLWFVKTAHL